MCSFVCMLVIASVTALEIQGKRQTAAYPEAGTPAPPQQLDGNTSPSFRSASFRAFPSVSYRSADISPAGYSAASYPAFGYSAASYSTAGYPAAGYPAGGYLASGLSTFPQAATFSQAQQPAIFSEAQQSAYLNQAQQPATLSQAQQSAYLSQAQQSAILSQAQQSAYLSQAQQPASPKNVVISQGQQEVVASSTAAPETEERLSSEALERIEPKNNVVEQTSNHIDERVEIPIPTPYPVTYESKVPFTKSFPASAPRTVQIQELQANSAPYTAPQTYSFPQPTSIPAQTYSVSAPQLQLPVDPFFSQYSFANPQQLNIPNAPLRTTEFRTLIPTQAPLNVQRSEFRTVIPNQASLVNVQRSELKTVTQTQAPTVKEPQRISEIKTEVRAQAPLVNAPQPLQLNAPLTPQIYYNGAPNNFGSLPEIYSTAQPIAAPLLGLTQPTFSLPQQAFSYAQPAFNLPEPTFSLQHHAISVPVSQPSISLQQPLFSARQLNLELSALAPTTIAPITFDATPTPLPITINTARYSHIPLTVTSTPVPITVTSTPAPITLQAVQSSVYDGPSNSYLPPPPENSIKRK